MSYGDDVLSDIFDRTSGRCHLCHKQVAFKNYGVVGARGGWEVDHSRARSRGGSGHGNNLYAACWRCNRSKGNVSTRTARAWNGYRRAPLSVEKRQSRKEKNALAAGLLGGLVGWMAGPAGLLAGAALGAALGYETDPDQ